MNRLVIIAASAVLALMLTACGESDKSAPTPPPPVDQKAAVDKSADKTVEKPVEKPADTKPAE